MLSCIKFKEISTYLLKILQFVHIKPIYVIFYNVL